ncbi:hypothetical protein BJ878DRAFT_505974 [Calycina marina]|uniref:RRM domain-containing protein n=1 Tax=Calycina marina TaxID=1763456 RepID=A0A9P8CGI5_9HELO|nr:hypothetical protein BJ878DRAFT_505974 [Calycina marina]
MAPIAVPDVDAADSKPKKEKSSKKRNPIDSAETSTSTKKSKSKDKSSKKRKADPAATKDATEEHNPIEDIKKTKQESDDVVMDDPAEPVENGGADSTNPPTKKRKRKLSVDEIEVDVTAPEPPSKKALRLLKKGKPLPSSKSGAEPTAAEAEAKKEVEKRSGHGIWIGNLPFFISKDDLRKFFVEFSDITQAEITRVHMPGPNDKKSANHVEERKFGKGVHNKGFAYVDFSSEELVEKAIELSEQLLGGRKVLIKNEKSFEGRPEKTKEEARIAGKPPNKRVFLGNLRFDATEESLKEHFDRCGVIETLKVATFEDSGKCKGYAWITFETLEAAEKAVKGFVMVEEEGSDNESESSELEADSDEEKASKPKAKKTKLRKWWINKIMGRPLKIEYAEDAQVRYKKRYGKDGTKSTGALGDGEDKPVRVPTAREPKALVKYDLPYGGAHLTGGIVEATGKKITF